MESMDVETVGQRMTKNPVTIPADLNLSDATQRMFDHGIRHLPVIDDGHVVGVVSERDLALVKSIPGVEEERVRVVEAMTEHPYMVAPNTPLLEVIDAMCERKIGTALVMDEGEIRGIFSVIDGLAALRDRLRAP